MVGLPTTARTPESAPAERPDPAGAALNGPPASRWHRTVTTPVVALLSFLTVATGLLLHNANLFTDRLYEVGDAAANSLLVNDAQAFSLLFGHYSRVGFNHPGPAVLYVQAAGESLFTDLLGIAAGPFNGQVMAILLLQAATIAAVVGIVFSWSRRWPVAAAALAATLVWYEAQTYSISSTWMPHVVVAPFLLLMVAAASVAAGNVRHLWLLAASAGLLVHAHVEFALFAPALTAGALAAWAVRERLGPHALWRTGPRAWTLALAVTAAFVLPILANTLLNWPGEIPKYLSYSSNQAQSTPTLPGALHYARQFWIVSDSPFAKLVPFALLVLASAAAWWAPSPLRRPLLALTGAAILAEALFVLYALFGIDDLSQEYVGLFTWSIPLALILVVTASLVHRVAGTAVGAAALALLAIPLMVVSLRGDGVSLRPDSIAGLPQTIAAVEQAAGDRTVVLDIGPGAPFVEGPALLVHFEREGRPVCFINDELRVQLTAARLCSAEQRRTGQLFQLRQPDPLVTPTFRGQASDITVVP